MKKLGLAIGVLLLFTIQAQAAPITFEFCGFTGASTSCEGLSSAKLTFDLNTGTTDDLNDYLATASFTGSATDPHPYLDFFSFAFNGVQTPEGYEGVPTFTSPPNTDYQFVFDNVSNGGTPCVVNTNQSQEVCANSPGLGEALGTGTVQFGFLVNFADGPNAFMIPTTGAGVNLRALFTNADGSFDGPILSPNGQYSVPPGFPPPPPPPTPVPEPASMMLMGTGLFAIAARFRKRVSR